MILIIPDISEQYTYYGLIYFLLQFCDYTILENEGMKTSDS